MRIARGIDAPRFVGPASPTAQEITPVMNAEELDATARDCRLRSARENLVDMPVSSPVRAALVEAAACRERAP